MRTNLTSEQHRFEAGRLMDDSVEWKFVYERTGDFACLAWARAKWLQAKWHERRQQERMTREAVGRIIHVPIVDAKTGLPIHAGAQHAMGGYRYSCASGGGGGGNGKGGSYAVLYTPTPRGKP